MFSIKSRYIYIGPLYKVRGVHRCRVLAGPDKGQMFLHGKTADLKIDKGCVTANEAYMGGYTLVGVYK